MRYSFKRDKNNKNPYDLGAIYVACNKCGKEKRPDSPYEPMNVFREYCNCDLKKIKK